jgi:hypothetical protein
MSFTDRLMVYLHVTFAIFAIGPVTIATMSSPRYIRTRNVVVLRYLLRITRIFGAVSLGVLIFGIAAGQALNKLGSAWLTVSMTLFVVALVLLVLIMRDQRRAITALEAAGGSAAAGVSAQAPGEAGQPATGESEQPAPAAGTTTPAGHGQAAADTGAATGPAASVERGRIASMAGFVSLIWLAILVLMIWNS